MPLAIFDPRPKKTGKWWRDCLEAKSPLFGVAGWAGPPAGMAGTGCTAEILEVTSRYDERTPAIFLKP